MVKKVTSQRVRQSMVSMLIGRPLSALGGMAVLVLLSRTLSAAEYGQYFSLWAMAEILILASNFGLIHAAYRYVSADEGLDGGVSPRGPLGVLMVLRCLSLVPAAFVMHVFPELPSALGGQALDPSMLASLGVIVAAEGMARYLESVFDSMLCQGRSQLTLLSRTLIRLAGYGYVLWQGPLHLQQVIQIEILATMGGAALGFILLAVLLRNAPSSSKQEIAPSPGWRSMALFAFPAYLAQLLTLVYGPDALKLILAANAGPAALALFGFAYSLAAVVLRYIPANLLAGVFRPVFVAAAKKSDADDVLSALIGMSIKINWMVILPILCMLWNGGSQVMSAVSGGRYPDAGSIVSTVVVALLLIAVHLVLSMYCLAIGISTPVLLATAASACCLPMAIFLARNHGAHGISAVFLLTELVWCAVCYALVRRASGGRLSLDWGGLARLVGASVQAILIGELLLWFGVHWIAVALISTLQFLGGVLVLMPFSVRERQWLATILPGGRYLKLKMGTEIDNKHA